MAKGADEAFWDNIPVFKVGNSEAEVEDRLVRPLFLALGYELDDIHPKFPVIFQEGRNGRPPEADFVCFAKRPHAKDTSLVVIEAKRPGEPLPEGKAQGESYAQNLRARVLVTTDGLSFEIWQLQISKDSQLVLKCMVSDLLNHRPLIEATLGKDRIIAVCNALGIKSIPQAATEVSSYVIEEWKRLLHEAGDIPRTFSNGSRVTEGGASGLITGFPNGAVIVAASGMGKTTLAVSLIGAVIKRRFDEPVEPLGFDVPLPDLEASDLGIVDFILERVAAHEAGFSKSMLEDHLRRLPTIIVCDSFDKCSADFQKKLTGRLTTFRRDFPRP